MYAIDVTFKNGKKMRGLIWSWEPQEGWFKALDESNGLIDEYQLGDIKNGVFYSDRIRELSKKEDLMEKAKSEGYL